MVLTCETTLRFASTDSRFRNGLKWAKLLEGIHPFVRGKTSELRASIFAQWPSEYGEGVSLVKEEKEG
jgi:hypothetical protein